MTKKTQPKRHHEDFQEYLLTKLKNAEFALAYLNEALSEKDQRYFLFALKNVLQAHGNDMTEIAQEAHLSRQNLYRILSEKGNPQLASMRSILHTVGLELAVQPYKGK